ncbi:fimbria/pilus periplasmic chaperone [Pantoea anthophila]|uniref:fimbria/pilus periplasmic chaperone n=1 Tax=Pantoea anthophila TaxID=470931 RepID=UPI002DBEDD5C|nr:fimbria/pilus periplasmic chaperone [Pantoea anthophila]MEB7540288.1 fimbria/pilus periplasmic chaperone [Pantoea anthophila]
MSTCSNLLLAGMLMLNPTASRAIVNSTQSRLVFNEKSMAESLTVVNSVTSPALVQVWTDDDDPLSPPDRISTPLIVVPPMFRLSPGESRNLRVMIVSRKGMPADRERVYWLNIYQIPPNTEQKSGLDNKIILPLRVRLKVFIRPSGLKDPEEEIGEKLRFTLSQSETRNARLTVMNPTPYYMTPGSMTLGKTPLQAEMIAPFSSVTIPVDAVRGDRILNWTVIDDYGKQISFNRELSW